VQHNGERSHDPAIRAILAHGLHDSARRDWMYGAAALAYAAGPYAY
jgi:hypothetical protein